MLVLCLCLPVVLAHAQGGTASASLSGTIVDQTGAVLPGVTVMAVNAATNQSRTAISNAEGRYQFTGLPPATYSLTAELQGFGRFTRPAIVLNIGAAVDFSVTLRLSSVEESITVSANEPIIEVARTDLSTVVTQQQIETLPTMNRTYLDFATLTPSVTTDVSTTGWGVGFVAGGARSKEGSLLVDGIWNTDESFAYPKVKYSQDAIDQFQVINMGATAEFGRAIGGIVNAITKSGGNTFGGTAYGFFRDKSLNAEDFMAKAAGLPKPPFDRQLYGGTVGGPIVRNRIFFFAAVERSVMNTPYNNNITPANGAVIGLPAEDVGMVNSYLQDTFVMGKINYKLNDNDSIQVTYAVTKESLSNIVSSFTTRSRKSLWPTVDQSFQFLWTGVRRNGAWLHDLRVAYFPRNFSNTYRDEGGPPLTPDGQLRASYGPMVNISSVANFGGGYIINNMLTQPVQIVYSSSILKGKHSLKFGEDAMLSRFYTNFYAGPQTGTYSFSNLANFLSGRYTTYSEVFGPSEIHRFHTYL